MMNAQPTAIQPTDAKAHLATVLVVEDEPLPRLALSDHLQDSGFKVYEAQSTREAIEILESAASIDLVFTDVQLAGVINGIGLATWLRNKRPHIKLVVTSGFSSRRETVEKTSWVNAPFIPKPYDLGHVERVIRKTLAE